MAFNDAEGAGETDPMDDEGWLATIRERPDDQAARRGYADWLVGRGDPRAEFLQAESRLRDASFGDRSRRALGRAWREARMKQDPAWLARVEVAPPAPGWLPVEVRRPPENGLDDWREWAARSHYEWVLLAVLAPIEDVARTVVELGMGMTPEGAVAARRWLRGVAVGSDSTTGSRVGRIIPFLQLTGHAWTIAMYCTFNCTISAMNAAEAHALALSDRLGTLVATYAAEDTSSAVGYVLFECGEEIETFDEEPGEITFGSKRRPPPDPSAAKDVDGDLFRALGLYLPGFYADSEGGVHLDVPGPSRRARADLLDLDFGSEPLDHQAILEASTYRTRMSSYPAIHVISIDDFGGYDPEGYGGEDEDEDEPKF